MTAPTSTHYDTLRIDRQATAQAVRRAWRSLAQECHPDRSVDTQAGATMARINEAYAVLSDPISRTHYDRALAAREGRTVHAPARAVSGTRSGAGLAGWLLSGAVSLAALTAGYAALHSNAHAPAEGAGSVHASDAEPLRLVPARRIQPWDGHARATLRESADAEPATWLLREVSMQAPALRRHDTASVQ